MKKYISTQLRLSSATTMWKPPQFSLTSVGTAILPRFSTLWRTKFKRPISVTPWTWVRESLPCLRVVFTSLASRRELAARRLALRRLRNWRWTAKGKAIASERERTRVFPFRRRCCWIKAIKSTLLCAAEESTTTYSATPISPASCSNKTFSNKILRSSRQGRSSLSS